MAATFPCDILVVGAGPGGSRAAAAAVREGARVVMIEAKTRIGEQPHCGEFVSARLFTELGLDDTSIVQRVDSMETLVLAGPDDRVEGSFGETVLQREISSPGFLIDRPRFDRDLARQAAALGAIVLSSTRLIRKEGPEWLAVSGREELSFRPRVVVAADGALSRVAKCIGLEAPELLTGAQCEVPLVQQLSKTIVFLHPSFVGGYGWLFPKGLVANVGLGISPGSENSPASLLDKFLAFLVSQGLIREGILSRTGGVIPVSGLRESLVRDNVVFCGDAAGLTHPITGAGIPQAVFSGDAAGIAAAKTSESGDYRHLTDYEIQMTGAYGGVIRHARSKRVFMREAWNQGDFSALCQETWIGFRGYNKRIRPEQAGSNGKTAE
jgi:digeranylgeranylglycerophospholipid reductase